MRERSFPFALTSALLVLASIAACTSGGGGGGGGDDDDDDDDDAASPITVTGTIETWGGNPLAGEDVLLNGTLLTTNSAGQFTLANVTPPYQLVHYYATGDDLIVYLGATRPDPVLTVISGSPDSLATVSGTISPAIGAGPTLTLQATAPPIYGQSSGSFTTNSYANRQLRWFQTASVNTTLHFIRYESDLNGIVNNFIDYKAQAVTLDDGSTPTIDVTMDAAVEGALTGTVTVPAGYEIEQVEGEVYAGNEGILNLGSTTASSFSFVTLANTGVSALVEATCVKTGLTSDEGYGIAAFKGPPTSAPTLVVPEAGAFTAPAANATIAAGTPVTWTNGIAGAQAHIVFMTPDDFSGTSMRFMYGGAPGLTIPDVSALGVALGTEAYTVRAISFAPGPTTDDFLAPGGLQLSFGDGLSYTSSTPSLPVMGP